MDQFLAFGIVGLSTAAIYAIIASGLVVTYTTTGVFNFAHGAAGMMAAFAYWQLYIGWHVPMLAALAIVLLVLAPLFGLLVELAMRPVAGLGEAERLVMTVALLSGLIAIAQWIWDPNTARSLPTFFSSQKSIHIGDATLTWHQILTMVIAVVVAIALRFILFRTRSGTEMRATVDDRALVGLTGANPVRANRLAWILGIELAAVGGVLIASTVQLDATQLSLLIVDAYAAAIFGRLRSIPMTFVGAIAVGLTESYLTGYLPQNAYLPGLRLAAPAIVLLLALLVFPHGRLQGRVRQLTQVPLPTLRGTAIFAGVIVAFGVVLATVLSESDLISYGQIFAFGIIGISFVPLAGYAGQISLCQITLAGIGAMVCAHVGAQGQWWALLATMGIAAVVGAVLALPALRLSGVYLALGTAAIAVIFDRWIFTLPSFHVFGVKISLFDQGSVSLVGPDLFGFRIDTVARTTIFAAVCLALVTLGVAALRRGRLGRRLIALRDSEAAYATLGGNLLVAKMFVFALSAGIAGLGGALYGMQLQSVTAQQFSFVTGLPIFLVAVLGGLGAVGNGLFTGTVIAGPLGAIGVLWPSLQNLAQVIPAAGGIAFAGRALRRGAVSEMREQWEPALQQRSVAFGLAAWTVLLWVLRLTDVINGYVLFIGVLLAAVVVPIYAKVRAERQSDRGEKPSETAGSDRTGELPEPDVPVELWGLARPWRAEDEEVLNREILARG